MRHDFILLDLDGTISDPHVGIGRSINYALSHFGYPEIDLERLTQYIGPPLDEAFKAITGLENPEAIRGLVAKFRERYGEVGYSENVLYEGIPEVVEALRQAGVGLGVCTSKRRDFAERILDMFGLRGHFSFVDGGEVGIHKWQQVKALRESGRIGDMAVMVGDRAFDLIAAHRNGLQSAGVLWGYGSREELEGEQPQYLFAYPAELVQLVGSGQS